MATTGRLNEWLAAGVITASGVAAASCNVRFYQPGTLTPETVYSDAAAASPITQPKVLSSVGTALVYATKPVRMIVKDAADSATLYDVTENVTRADQTYVTSTAFFSGTETALSTIMDGWATTGGGGVTSAWKYKRSANATERNLKDAIGEVQISVKDRGAVGDGLTDDTSAIQAAITELASAGGGTVFLPPGTYIISSALTMGTSGVSLRGTGPVSSVLKNTGAASNAITCTSMAGFSISELGITHASNSTGSGIQLASCGSAATGSITITNVSVLLHRTGLNLTGTTGFVTLNGSIMTTPGSNAAERAIQMNSTGSASLCIRATGNYLGGGIGSALEFSSSSVGHIFVENMFVGTTGITINAAFSGSVILFRTNYFSPTNTTQLSVGPATMPGGVRFDGNNGLDGTTVNVTSGGSVTPNRALGGYLRIRGTSTSVAYTINAPTPAGAALTGERDVFFTIAFYANAGAPITGWGLNAIYHVSAAPSLTDGDTTTYVFRWDVDRSIWQEQSRSVSA